MRRGSLVPQVPRDRSSAPKSGRPAGRLHRAKVPARNSAAAVSVAMATILIWPSGRSFVAAPAPRAWRRHARPMRHLLLLVHDGVRFRRRDSVHIGVGEFGCKPDDPHEEIGGGFVGMAALRMPPRSAAPASCPRSRPNSSRSTMRASAPLVIALSSFLALSAGTKSNERIGHSCHSGAARSEGPGVDNHDDRNCTLPQVSFAQGVWIS